VFLGEFMLPDYHGSARAIIDGVTLLKIWNMNRFTGVFSVYNC
jgi:hypothetical protein